MGQTVKRNQVQYELPLKIVSYNELYGWTMDAIVKEIGLKNNCELPLPPPTLPVHPSYPSVPYGTIALTLVSAWPCACAAGTFCGVFRRQALDRGASLLRADCMVTGHNADDMAETVLMNSACCMLVHSTRHAGYSRAASGPGVCCRIDGVVWGQSCVVMCLDSAAASASSLAGGRACLAASHSSTRMRRRSSCA